MGFSVWRKRDTNAIQKKLSKNTSPELELEIAFNLCFACEFFTL